MMGSIAVSNAGSLAARRVFVSLFRFALSLYSGGGGMV